jgi:hypothetical protein
VFVAVAAGVCLVAGSTVLPAVGAVLIVVGLAGLVPASGHLWSGAESPE